MELHKRILERNFSSTFLITTFVLLLFAFTANHVFHKEQTNVDSETEFVGSLHETIVPNASLSQPTEKSCTFYTCFDVYKCSHSSSGKISVHVYPITQYVDEDGVPVTKKISKEFYRVLQAIKKSEFYTSDESNACILIPSIDMLNQNHIRRKEASKALASLPL